MQEIDIIEKIILKATKVNSIQDGVKIGIGDDAALLDTSNIQDLVIANDSMIENVHFPMWASAYSVGVKLATVNLSDLAACGARPLWANLALSLPSDLSIDWVKQFISGLSDQLRAYGVRLVGGDTCCSKEINVGLTVLGSAKNFISRSGARVGDNIYISGTLGNAALALGLANQEVPVPEGAKNREKYRSKVLKKLNVALLSSLENPQPCVQYASKMLNFASSMIDISDGLVSDLCHILRRSNLSQNQDRKIGATLFLNEQLISNVFKESIHLLKNSLSNKAHGIKGFADYWGLVLSGGDDYRLCYTVPETRQEDWLAFTQKYNLLAINIGEITNSGNLIIEGAEVLSPKQLYSNHGSDFKLKGFEHSFD